MSKRFLCRKRERRGLFPKLKSSAGESMNIRTSLSPTATETKRLEGLLTDRLGSRVRGLRLVFEQTGVILRGRSETYHAKQIAQHAVMEITAEPILANEIEVK
jgi:hypothetical protein